MRLLVVDDEPWNVNWIKDFAEARGAETTLVRSCDEAVKYCEKRLPNVAIVDIMMGTSELSLEGKSFEKIPDTWEGIKFLRHLRVDMRVSMNTTKVLVYTVLDREELVDIVERTLSASYFTKNDVHSFRRALDKALCR